MGRRSLILVIITLIIITTLGWFYLRQNLSAEAPLTTGQETGASSTDIPVDYSNPDTLY